MEKNKQREVRNTYKIHEKDKVGEVQIADEVVAIIAALAATEVEGVVSTSGNITQTIAGGLGMKNLAKGVRVEVTGNTVNVDLALILQYGYNIPDVSVKVQEKVQTAIENMTGLHVGEVNIRITAVNLER